jgi:hypothetical protein
MTSSAPATPASRTNRPLRSVPAPASSSPAAPALASTPAVAPATAAASVPLAAAGTDRVPPRTTATQFSECVRAIVTLARRRGLRPPAFRSPPRIAGVDRSIQRRRNGAVMVAIRRGDRPFAAIQGDVIEGVVAANHLSGEPADRFRSAAWAALEGSGATAGSRTAVESARVSRASRAVGRVA